MVEILGFETPPGENEYLITVLFWRPRRRVVPRPEGEALVCDRVEAGGPLNLSYNRGVGSGD